MNEFLYWYIIFAITTAVVSNFVLLKPIFKELKLHVDHPHVVKVLSSKILVVIIFNIAALITAPLMFVAVIIEEKKHTFIKSFVRGVMAHD